MLYKCVMIDLPHTGSAEDILRSYEKAHDDMEGTVVNVQNIEKIRYYRHCISEHCSKYPHLKMNPLKNFEW